MESESRKGERDKMRECKRRGGRKLKADYLVSESLVPQWTGERSRGRKPDFSLIVFIKAGPNGNQEQLKITTVATDINTGHRLSTDSKRLLQTKDFTALCQSLHKSVINIYNFLFIHYVVQCVQ